MRRLTGRRLLLTCLLIFSTLGALAGCTAEDVKFVQDMAEEWARSKNLNPTNADGSISLSGAWNAGVAAVTGSTGDKEADAVVAAFQMVQNFQAAEDLMEKGRKNRDASLMDQAIDKRPNDYTYKLSRAALALEKGDLAAFTQYESASQDVRPPSEAARRLWVDQRLRDLEAVNTNLKGQFVSGEQCYTLYNSLANQYTTEGNTTGNQAYAASATKYFQLAASCKR